MEANTTATAAGDDVRWLLRRWHKQGDRNARDQLVERMLPLAKSLARRYQNKGEPLDDLEQVACVGLIKAIDRFDLDREVRFATFAVPTIAGEIKRHFRDRGWMMRVPARRAGAQRAPVAGARAPDPRPRPLADGRPSCAPPCAPGRSRCSRR